MGRQRLSENSKDKVKKESFHCKECGRRFKLRPHDQRRQLCGVKRCEATPEQRDGFMVKQVERRLG